MATGNKVEALCVRRLAYKILIEKYPIARTNNNNIKVLSWRKEAHVSTKQGTQGAKYINFQKDR